MKLSTIGWGALCVIGISTMSPAGLLLSAVGAVKVASELTMTEKCLKDLKEEGLKTGEIEYTIQNEELIYVILNAIGNLLIHAENCGRILLDASKIGELKVPESCAQQTIECTDPKIKPHSMTLYGESKPFPDSFFTDDPAFFMQSSFSQVTVQIPNSTVPTAAA